MRQKRSWPDALLLVRHGESEGNVARDRAEAEGLAEIALDRRDMDVPLSARGERQAAALGRWLASLPPSEQPTAVLASPYVRARDTGRLAVDAAGLDVELSVDERLREREFGILDRLTKAGIRERYPEQAELRSFLGKFYHRPPCGESWADVALRVRSIADELSLQYEGERVMIVAHQVVILMFRYVLERLSEAEVLEIDQQHDLANCSVTRYELEGERPVLRKFNSTTPVSVEGETVTRERDAVSQR